MQTYVQAAIHCRPCEGADSHDFPEAGRIVVWKTYADGLTAGCLPSRRHRRVRMAAVLDEEGILQGWARDCHGCKDLSRSVDLRAEHLSDEVRPDTVIVEQLGTGGARIQESLSALPDGAPLLMLSSKRGGRRKSLPSVVAGRTSV